MSSSDRIFFDADQIDDTARAVRNFRSDFDADVKRVQGERDRSITSFTGVAGDEFRAVCDRWLSDADDFAAALDDVAAWLDSTNARYADAHAASRSMFPG